MNSRSEPIAPDLRDPLLERLGDGVHLDADRRGRLLDRLAPMAVPAAASAGATAKASARPRGRRIRLWWAAPAAAAAAVVLAAVAVWPAATEAVLPTDILGAFFGPLPALADPAEPIAEPVAEPAEFSYVTDALAYVWGDLEGPMAVARQAVQAPRSLTANEPSVPAAAGGPDALKED
ncbi:MAG: hypothetical protein ISS74_01665 [Planctomycetes bacterium]|nr:hypothetical protein [Planctomycetota bacterium]